MSRALQVFALARTALFTAIVPGIVAGFVPLRVIGRDGWDPLNEDSNSWLRFPREQPLAAHIIPDFNSPKAALSSSTRLGAYESLTLLASGGHG